MKPFSLPAGWGIKPFGQCIKKVKYTEKQPTKSFLPEGKFPIVSQEKELISGYSNNQNAVFSVKSPVVIFGDHTKVVKYIDFDFVIGADGVKILQPIEEINAKYFYYYLIHLHLRDLGYARHYKLLKECVVFYPPLSEQKRIVEKLDKIFAAIDKAKSKTEKSLQNAKDVFSSYLNNIFNHSAYNWEEKTLGEVCDIYIGKTPARSNISYWDKNKETNNIWLSIADLLNTTNKQVFSSKEFLSNKGASLVPIVEPGTLLLSFKLTIGRVAFAGVPLRTNEAIAQLPIQDSQILDKNYLYYYLQYYDYEQLLRGDVKVKGKTLNKEKLKNLTVQYPSLPEQKRIVEKLDILQSKTQELEKIYTQKLADLEELKQSVLQQAFNGKL